MTTKTVEAYKSSLNDKVIPEVLKFKKDLSSFFSIEITKEELSSSSDVITFLRDQYRLSRDSSVSSPDYLSYYLNLFLIKAILDVAQQYVAESSKEARAGFFGSKPRRHAALIGELPSMREVFASLDDEKTSTGMNEKLREIMGSIREKLEKGVSEGCNPKGNYANLCRAIAELSGWDFSDAFKEKLGIETTAPAPAA
jgi:hypothetical protein